MAGGMSEDGLLVDFNRFDDGHTKNDYRVCYQNTQKPHNALIADMRWSLTESFRRNVQSLESELVDVKQQQQVGGIHGGNNTQRRHSAGHHECDSKECEQKLPLSTDTPARTTPQNPLALFRLGGWYSSSDGCKNTSWRQKATARGRNDQTGDTDSVISGATANISPYASAASINNVPSSSTHTRGSLSTTACGKTLSTRALQKMTEFKNDSIVTHRWEDITDASPDDYVDEQSFAGTPRCSQSNLSTPSLPRIAENEKPQESYQLDPQDGCDVPHVQQQQQQQQQVVPKVIRDDFDIDFSDSDSEYSDSDSDSEYSDSESECSDSDADSDSDSDSGSNFFDEPPPAHLLTSWLMQQAELGDDYSFSSAEDTFMFFDEEEEDIMPLDMPGAWTSAHDRGMQKMPISQSLHTRPSKSNDSDFQQKKASDLSKSTSATSATSISSSVQESAWPLHVVSVDIPKLRPEVKEIDTRNELAGLDPEDFEEFWSPERREQEMRKQLAMALKTYQTSHPQQTRKKKVNEMDVSTRNSRRHCIRVNSM